ncbi:MULTISPECIES: HAMP domain-containing sensor histidine kinase [unclassified Streptomyces]|uniref:sensor histidine kinase n=1 Tax=unclassified Streptomyces TaxID=2593676 RepID=UPI000823A081|nr:MULTISPECIES: HAMP domain-containing sensor histidine kinase [unclassified Streptomyces]MYU02229.1 HAMP domain-containing protein [Streptomyces sp. SID8350]SCK63454.1 two-component system, OmpR family, sensor histidine kinase MtrB [Streptomyces sp. AmelKG-D3]
MRLVLARGLRPRLVVAFVLVAALSALLTAALTYQQARNAILERSRDTAVQELRRQVDALVPNLPPDPTDADLRIFASQLDHAAGDGRRTAVSRNEGPLLGTAQDIGTALRAATRNGDTTYAERVASPGKPRLLIGMPVRYDEQGRGAGKPSGLVVYAALPLDAERADIAALITAAWAGAVPALVLAVIPALLAARGVLRPVRQLRSAAERITAGALDTRLTVVGKDELAGLTDTFNTMATTLERGDAELRRMEAKAVRFAADVSHELRTPLAAMAAVTDALDEDAHSGVLPAETADAVLLVSEEARKLAVMVEDLMEISRFDAGSAVLRPDELSLRTVIHKTLELRGWREPGDVIIELPEGDPRVRADPRRLDVVLANLIGNALRHGAAPVTVRAACGPEAVVIEVADRGPGIPDDVLPHVFDRFYKADAARGRSEGSGLGLAIAAENVRLHGGTLTAAKQPGGGAVFRVTLPDRRASEEPS